MKWHLEARSLSSLTPHPKNARTLSKDEAKHLKKSLTKFGLIDKPIITPSGLIIGGHQRINVLREMGHSEIECWVSDTEEWSDRDIDELNIRLNRNTGSWDWDKLANEWNTTDLFEWGFTDGRSSRVRRLCSGGLEKMTESTLPPFLTCEEMDICLKFVKFITTNPSKPPLNSSRDKLLKEFVRFMGKLPNELLLHDEKVGPYNPALILYLGMLSYTEGGVTFLDMRFKDGVFRGSVLLKDE